MELATLWDARTEGGNDSEFRQTTSGAHGTPIVCPEESLWPSAVCGHSAMSARDAASMGSSPALTPEGFQRANGKPFGAPAGAAPSFPMRD